MYLSRSALSQLDNLGAALVLVALYSISKPSYLASNKTRSGTYDQNLNHIGK